MKNVLTLIGNRTWAPLAHDMVAMAIGGLEEAGASVADQEWLSEEHACDIPFDGISAVAGETAARQYLQDLPIDLISQPRTHRRKKLLLSDMDSTIIQQECIDEIAACVGLRDQVSEITEAAMRGELDFTASLIRRAAMLKGLQETILQQVYDQNITLTPGAETLVRTMRQAGAHTELVSGGFTWFTNLIATRIAFHAHQANVLEIIDGQLTGMVMPPVLDKMAKAHTLEACRIRLGLKIEQTMAVGDGANDIPMLQAANLGIAFHAKPLVAASASARLDHADLTGALYAQGYKDDEFVTD